MAVRAVSLAAGPLLLRESWPDVRSRRCDRPQATCLHLRASRSLQPQTSLYAWVPCGRERSGHCPPPRRVPAAILVRPRAPPRGPIAGPVATSARRALKKRFPETCGGDVRVAPHFQAGTLRLGQCRSPKCDLEPVGAIVRVSDSVPSTCAGAAPGALTAEWRGCLEAVPQKSGSELH